MPQRMSPPMQSANTYMSQRAGEDPYMRNYGHSQQQPLQLQDRVESQQPNFQDFDVSNNRSASQEFNSQKRQAASYVARPNLVSHIQRKSSNILPDFINPLVGLPGREKNQKINYDIGLGGPVGPSQQQPLNQNQAINQYQAHAQAVDQNQMNSQTQMTDQSANYIADYSRENMQYGTHNSYGNHYSNQNSALVSPSAPQFSSNMLVNFNQAESKDEVSETKFNQLIQKYIKKPEDIYQAGMFQHGINNQRPITQDIQVMKPQETVYETGPNGSFRIQRLPSDHYKAEIPQSKKAPLEPFKVARIGEIDMPRAQQKTTNRVEYSSDFYSRPTEIIVDKPSDLPSRDSLQKRDGYGRQHTYTDQLAQFEHSRLNINQSHPTEAFEDSKVGSLSFNSHMFERQNSAQTAEDIRNRDISGQSFYPNRPLGSPQTNYIPTSQTFASQRQVDHGQLNKISHNLADHNPNMRMAKVSRYSYNLDGTKTLLSDEMVPIDAIPQLTDTMGAPPARPPAQKYDQPARASFQMNNQKDQFSVPKTGQFNFHVVDSTKQPSQNAYQAKDGPIVVEMDIEKLRQ